MNPVTLADMLQAREARAQRQQALLARFGCPVICFTMNIAGPVKTGPEIRRAFLRGDALLCRQLAQAGLSCRYRAVVHKPTGDEALYAVQASPAGLKAITVALEDRDPLGRLYDMDVLEPGGHKVDRATLGLPPRRCLLCQQPAAVCARSRAHRLDQLQARTAQLLTQCFRGEDRNAVASLAVRSLLYEVCVTPKPGLVDREDSGSHTDMDIFTFLSSASALWFYFAQCAETGMDTRNLPPQQVLPPLRKLGQAAEEEMYRATGGVNTHKGAIFSLGIACAAAGRLPRSAWGAPEAVAAMAGEIAQGIVAADFAGLTWETAKTAGEKLYLRYGLTGVRGQVEAGLPAVLQAGLPTLEARLAQGKDMNDAGCAALLALMATGNDTNLIARGGLSAGAQVAQAAAGLLAAGPTPQSLRQMNWDLVSQHLSPGGSADLLALCYFLHFLKQEALPPC